MSDLFRITNVQIENNPCHIQDKFRLQIFFEADKKLPYEVDWELIYIGSAKDQQYDQVLEQFSTPVEQGQSAFTLETNAPDLSKIPSTEDLLGVSAIIFSVSYCKQEFFRLGYYTANHYTDPILEQEPPQIPVIEKLQRSILSDKPRITRYNINWNIDLNPVQTKQIENTFQFDPFAQQTNIFQQQIQQPQIPFNHTMFSEEVSQPFPFNQNNNNNQQQQQQFFQQQQQQQPQINSQYQQQQQIFQQQQQQGFLNNQNNFNNNNANIYQQQQQFNQFQMQQPQQAVFQASNIFN